MRPGRWIAVAAAAGALLLIVPMLMVMVVLNEPSTHCPPGSDVVLADPAVEVGGLSAAQLEHAATIVDQGRAAGMPEKGIIVALATASQESGFKVYANDGKGSDLKRDQQGIAASMRLPHEAVGTDHGSLGVFQQQWPWWGTMEELMDPAVSAEKFYTALAYVVGWQQMPVTRAAQAVQNSAHPDAYADDEPLARQLYAALTGGSSDAVPAGDTDGGDDDDPYQLGPVQPQTRALVHHLAPRFGITTVGGYRKSARDPDGHPAGLAADFMVPLTPAGRAQGDRLAAYARQNAQALGVDYIIWWQRIWSPDRAEAGWRPMSDRGSPTENHLDHVHISVRPDGPLAPPPDVTPASYSECVTAAAVTSSRVVYPFAPGTPYVDQKNFGETGPNWARGHTGTDLSAACGIPVLAVHSGSVAIDTTQAWAGAQLVKVSLGPGQLTTWYAHLATVDVADGVQVEAGQQIGTVGAEGNATGCHLHLEVHPEGGGIYEDAVDPTVWLANNVGKTVGGGGDGSVIVPIIDTGPPPQGDGLVTLMSYNIKVGAYHGSKLGQVVREIESAQADIVVLNEIDHRRGEPPQATWLGRRLGMYAVYGPNHSWGGVRWRGNAILSEYPIVASSNTKLPWRPGTERRGLVEAFVDLGDDMIVRVTGTHLQPASSIKLVQANAVAGEIGSPTCPTFLLGDMNAGPGSSELKAMTRELRDPVASGRFGEGLTHPRSRPRGRIDFVLGSPQATAVASRVMPRWISDHRAVRTTFQLHEDASCE